MHIAKYLLCRVQNRIKLYDVMKRHYFKWSVRATDNKYLSFSYSKFHLSLIKCTTFVSEPLILNETLENRLCYITKLWILENYCKPCTSSLNKMAAIQSSKLCNFSGSLDTKKKLKRVVFLPKERPGKMFGQQQSTGCFKSKCFSIEVNFILIFFQYINYNIGKMNFWLSSYLPRWVLIWHISKVYSQIRR